MSTPQDRFKLAFGEKLKKLEPSEAPKAPEIISITGWTEETGGTVGINVILSWGSGYSGKCTEVVNVTTKTGCFEGLTVHASNQFDLNIGWSNDKHGAPRATLTAPSVYEADQLFIFLWNNTVIKSSGFKIRREVTQVNSRLRLVVIVEPYNVYNVPYGDGSYSAKAGGGNRISWIKDL